MTSRLTTGNTPADDQLRAILDEPQRRCFVMVAGAGSGKTTSLIKALHHVATTQARQLHSRSQQVACITYTDVAAEEIHTEAGSNPLVTVRTIHSFLWELARPFQRDIRRWAMTHTEDEIAELLDKQSNYPPRTWQSTKDKDAAELDRLRERLKVLAERGHAPFTYRTASNFSKGELGHENVLQMATSLIMGSDLLPKIISSKFPYIFVDESQDTFPAVVDALKRVAATRSGKTCLGFFGDPMQQIYQRGAGGIPLEEGWAQIEKPENFRSSTRVLKIANTVRAGGDGLVQQPGRPAGKRSEGESYFFILPADSERTSRLEQTRSWLGRHSDAGAWNTADTRILTVTHRLAANRLGFGSLYGAFNDKAESSLKDSFLEGTAWPLQPFKQVILPLCAAESATSPAVIRILRDGDGSALNPDDGSGRIREKLTAALSNVKSLREIVASDEPGSVRKVLEFAVQAGFIQEDPRILSCLGLDAGQADPDLSSSARKTFDAFCDCDVRELPRYFRHANGESPYSTHHGTKGAEFPKVIVVIDEEEGRHPSFDYEKLLGLKPLSPTDEDHQDAGTDSVVDRTRRLLYVCVSRAQEAVAVVLFARDPAAAQHALEDSVISADATIVTADDLAE